MHGCYVRRTARATTVGISLRGCGSACTCGIGTERRTTSPRSPRSPRRSASTRSGSRRRGGRTRRCWQRGSLRTRRGSRSGRASCRCLRAHRPRRRWPRRRSTTCREAGFGSGPARAVPVLRKGGTVSRTGRRSREYVTLVRSALAREEPLHFDGRIYTVPVPGAEGRSLKMNVVPLRKDVPIYLAAMGPKNVALTKEIADGWLPLLFSPEHADVFELESVDADFDVAPMVLTAIEDDLAAARDVVRPDIALYVGAYGPKTRNFYADLVRRYGFDADVDAIQGAALE